jgi:hypothetical protein
MTRNRYEERQEARRARYEERAERAREEASAKAKRATTMADCIPYGQPILVGHHSEGRDRRFRARIGQVMTQAVEAEKKADYYDQKAEGVGKGGISSDDPQAIEKLTAQLEKLEADSIKMKAANKAIRKNDREALAKLGYSEKVIEHLFKPDHVGRVGFADFELTGNRANARRIRQRIEILKKARERQDVEQEGKGYTYREDTEENRVMFEFEGKPDDATRQVLKDHSFRWSPSRGKNGAWVRHLNNSGIYNAQCVRKILDAMED